MSNGGAGPTGHPEAFYRALVEQAVDVLTVLDAEGMVRYKSPSVQRVLGYRPHDLDGRSVYEFIHPHDVPRLRSRLAALRETGGDMVARYRFLHRDGTWRVCESAVSNLLDDPSVRGWVVNSRDVTERERAAEALQESEWRFRRFFEQDLTGDYLADAQGVIVKCNPAFARIFGFASVDAARGTRIRDLAANPPEVLDAFGEVLRRSGRLEELEVDMRTVDGTVLHTIQNVVAEVDEQGRFTGLQGYVFDVTRYRQMEEQLRQSQKMEAVGQLAGGVAHDFNNMLMVITGFADLLRPAVGEAEPGAFYLGEIRKAADRAADLTRQLLAFGRRQVLQPRRVELNAAARDAARMLGRLIPESIAIRTELGADTGHVEVDPTQLHQVIVNLAVNARDAMPQGGVLSIRTSRVDVAQRRRSGDEWVEPGTWARLEMSDTGHGIPPEVMPHVFEPFFTTKELGRGTGLGLSTAYGIVRQSGGHLLAESAPGRGSTFTVLLPALPAAAGGEGADPAQRRPALHATVLLVEDDASVRLLARVVLEEQGHRVVEAMDGQEGVDRFAELHGRVDLVLADVLMPRMGAVEMLRRIRAGRPDLPVVLMSGYAADELPDGNPLPPRTMFLQKPFPPSALADAVDAALRGEPGGAG